MKAPLFLFLLASAVTPAAASESWPGQAFIEKAAGAVRSARELAPAPPRLPEGVAARGAAGKGAGVFILRGNANGSYASLRVDREGGSLRGNLNGAYVSLAFDRREGWVRGNANGSYWSLSKEKTGEGWILRGNANNAYVSLEYDAAAKRLRGNANGAYVQLLFEPQTSSLRGNADGAYVHLVFENNAVRGNAGQGYVSLEVDAAGGAVRGNANRSYLNLAFYPEGGGEADASPFLTFGEGAVIDALLLHLPTNLFGF